MRNGFQRRMSRTRVPQVCRNGADRPDTAPHSTPAVSGSFFGDSRPGANGANGPALAIPRSTLTCTRERPFVNSATMSRVYENVRRVLIVSSIVILALGSAQAAAQGFHGAVRGFSGARDPFCAAACVVPGPHEVSAPTAPTPRLCTKPRRLSMSSPVLGTCREPGTGYQGGLVSFNPGIRFQPCDRTRQAVSRRGPVESASVSAAGIPESAGDSFLSTGAVPMWWASIPTLLSRFGRLTRTNV
jgi:hypothetical protein